MHYSSQHNFSSVCNVPSRYTVGNKKNTRHWVQVVTVSRLSILLFQPFTLLVSLPFLLSNVRTIQYLCSRIPWSSQPALNSSDEIRTACPARNGLHAGQSGQCSTNGHRSVPRVAPIRVRSASPLSRLLVIVLFRQTFKVIGRMP